MIVTVLTVTASSVTSDKACSPSVVTVLYRTASSAMSDKASSSTEDPFIDTAGGAGWPLI